MICAAYGEKTVSHTTCKRWYQNFRPRDFSFEDEPHAGRPQKIETDELQALLNINSFLHKLKRSLQNSLGITQQAISVHLHMMGKLQKESRWVPHELYEDKSTA